MMNTMPNTLKQPGEMVTCIQGIGCIQVGCAVYMRGSILKQFVGSSSCDF